MLADRFDLQSAMLLIPLCFLLSGAGFFVAEQVCWLRHWVWCNRNHTVFAHTDYEGDGGATTRSARRAARLEIMFFVRQYIQQMEV